MPNSGKAVHTKATKNNTKEKQTVWFDDVVIAKEYVGPRIAKAD